MKINKNLVTKLINEVNNVSHPPNTQRERIFNTVIFVDLYDSTYARVNFGRVGDASMPKTQTVLPMIYVLQVQVVFHVASAKNKSEHWKRVQMRKIVTFFPSGP